MIDDIMKQICLFEVRTGKKASCVYLGEVEMIDLKLELLGQAIPGELIKATTFNNLPIFQVMEDTHIGVS